MHVIPFSDPRAQAVAYSGGKGANLARLTQFGFNVPTGLIVGRDAYDAFVAQAEATLRDKVAALDLTTPEALQADTAALQAWLRTLPLPDILGTALAEQLTQLEAQGISHVSVRSSATAEDTASAAFAGQHDTYLNVPLPEVAARVRDCWLSLWSDRAVAYRQQVGVPLLGTSMAVVVQQMVQADVAGVAFSVDPVAGDLQKVIIDANYGLGESVVSGAAEVDHWRLDKATGAVTDEALADKSMKIVSLPQGGTEDLALDGAERTAPCLTVAQLQELARTAAAIETCYGFPQDIEFAVAHGTLFILQARPITSIAPRWTRDESAERFPNPVSPLAWDLVEDGFHKSLNYSFDLMGLPPFEGKWFAMFDSYIYGNQNAVELYANGVPITLNSLDELRALLPVIREKYSWVQDLPLQWSRDLDWYLLRLGELNARDLDRLSLPQLWAHVKEVSETGARYFLPNIAISITQRVLYKVLFGMLAMAAGKDTAAQLFDALLAHCDTKTGAINQQLYQLAQAVQAHPDLTWDAPDALGRLQEALPEFAKDFERLLADHGHRETEFDPYVPTWAEAPTVVLDTLRVMAQGELHNPRENERQLKVRAQETLFAMQQRVPDDLRYFLTEVVRLAQTYTSLDDLEHYQTTRLTLPLRKGLRALGRQLQGIGIVAEPMDVFFAHRTTLDAAVTQPCVAHWQALADEIAQNKAIYLAARQRTPAWQLAEAEEALVEPTEGWKGIPGSPGKATGPVYLVHGTEDFGRFPKGAVLVARTTNPAWTPLFYGASAVVTESGGPLSHGAVTAREMQKPAVMAVRNVMQSLKNGDWVEVDGSRGLITRREPLDA